MSEVREQRSAVAGSAGILPATERSELRSPLTCPLCLASEPNVEFGMCSSRKSGRNLYCKSCVNKKVAEQRRSDAYRRTEIYDQGKLPLVGAAPMPKVDANGILLGNELRNPRQPHHERVLGAIHAGARTQREILIAIRPSSSSVKSEAHNSPYYQRDLDQLGESLAILMLNHPKRVKTQAVGDERQYFVVDQLRNPDSEIRNRERAA